MWSKLTTEREVSLHAPSLIVSVSTSMPQYRALYSQARELARYLLRKLQFQRLASLYASALPPAFLIRPDGDTGLVSTHFYHHAGATGDVVLFAGDSSPADEQYEFADLVLRYAQKLGTKDIISIGARWAEQPMPPADAPKVLGFATDVAGVERLVQSGVEVAKDEPAPFFASLVVGRAELYGMRGYKLSVNHGEPIPHPKSVLALIGVLERMLGLDVDKEELREGAARTPGTSMPANEGQPQQQRGDNIYH